MNNINNGYNNRGISFNRTTTFRDDAEQIRLIFLNLLIDVHLRATKYVSLSIEYFSLLIRIVHKIIWDEGRKVNFYYLILSMNYTSFLHLLSCIPISFSLFCLAFSQTSEARRSDFLFIFNLSTVRHQKPAGCFFFHFISLATVLLLVGRDGSSN